MEQSVQVWIIFHIFILGILALDLGVFHKNPREVSFKEAMWWSVGWVGLSLCFALLLYFWQGSVASLEFLTGYLIEKSLSVDNIFVILSFFSVSR